MRILVDTSAWIEFYHPSGNQQVKRSIAEALDAHDVATTAPIALELLSGARTDANFALIEGDLNALIWLPLSREAARRAAQIGIALSQAGRRPPAVDLLIAGAASAEDCEIWHFGDQHFSLITSAGGPSQRSLKAN